MRGLRHPYRWGRDHPLVVDVVFALGLAAFGLLTELVNAEEVDDRYVRETDALSLVLCVAGTLPLALRRRYPLTVYVVIAVATTIYYTREYAGAGPMIGILVGLYGVAAHSTRKIAVWTLAVTLTVEIVGTTIDPAEGDTIFTVIALSGLLIAAWVIGDNIRVRRAYVAAVEDRAEQLEREQDAQARRAVLEERSRIARELHDIVAHSMSVMVVQAGAARRTLDRDRDRAVEAISQIEVTGRDALAEMRRVVAVLRRDSERAAPPGEPGESDEAPGADAIDHDALVPQPGLDQLATLVEQCREAGLPVALAVTGDVRPLPSGIELTIYRIVQEALTNTMRHAGQARAEVELCFDDDVVRATVTDDGRGASADAAVVLPGVPQRWWLSVADPGRPSATGTTGASPPPGHGLAGMHERVALYGGTVNAGPRIGGGFAVRAEIPLGDGARTAKRATGAGRLLTGWWS